MIQELQSAGAGLMRITTRDASVKQLLDRFDKQASQVTADQMLELLDAASDYGQMSSQEWADIYHWVQKNPGRVSSDAHQMFAKVDETIQRGGGGIPRLGEQIQLPVGRAGKPILEGPALATLLGELARGLEAPAAAPPARPSGGDSSPIRFERSAPLPPPAEIGDQSAAQALERLSGRSGFISGRDLLEAIRLGTGDADNQAAGEELDAFRGFARTHGPSFRPEAREVMAIYERHAAAARAQGQTGMANADWNQMIAEMETALGAARPETEQFYRLASTADREATTNKAAKSTGSSSSSKAGKSKETGESGVASAGALAEKAGEVSQVVGDLIDEISSLDPDSKTYQRDLIQLQEKLHRAREQLQMLTQLLKALHEMNMGVIQNVRV